MDKKKIVRIAVVVCIVAVVVWKNTAISRLWNGGLNQNGKVGLETKEESVKLDGRESGTEKSESNGREFEAEKSETNGRESEAEKSELNGRESEAEKSETNGREFGAEKSELKEENSGGNRTGLNENYDANVESNKKRERIIVEDTDYSTIDNTLYAWWFKRNDNHEKSGCQDDFDITQFDAHYTVPVSEKKIYITFDCGYENGFTPDMLDVLKEEQVTAAFFVTQTFIRDNIELTKRMKEEGHLVCNHTVTHPSMPGKTVEEQKEELLTCERYMKEATGYEMDLFFRPPKGEYSQRTLQMAKDLGYTTVFWSMAYLDYDVNNQPSCDHVVDHFKKYYHPGAIPLLHNVSQANHDALKQVIQNLKKEGYSFGSLYDLQTGEKVHKLVE